MKDLIGALIALTLTIPIRAVFWMAGILCTLYGSGMFKATINGVLAAISISAAMDGRWLVAIPCVVVMWIACNFREGFSDV